MNQNIFDLDKTECHVWNVIRIIQRRVSETKGLLCILLLPLVLVISINEVHASKVPVTVPSLNSNIQTPEIPQPPQPPFDIRRIIDKAEHLVQRSKHHPDHYSVEDPAYRVEFTPEAVTYYQKRDGQNSNDHSLQFRLISVDASGKHIPVDRSSSLISVENQVIYSRAPLIKEIYDVRNNGVEQSWIIEQPLADSSGDIIINGMLTTDLNPKSNNKGGIDFFNKSGDYVTTYGNVTVIDKEGKRIILSPQYEDSHLTIRVPEKWLDEAVYPVVVDPVLGAADTQVDSLATSDIYPAIAFGASNYLIVWHTGNPNGTGTGGTAIKGIRVSATGTIIGAPLDIGDTLNRDDQFPSVTYHSATSTYIVVWMMWNSATSSNIYRNTVNATNGALGTSTSILAGGQRILSYPAVVCCDVNSMYYVMYGRASANSATDIGSFRGQTYSFNGTTHTAGTAFNTITAIVNSGGANSVTPTSEPKSAPRLYALSTSKYLLTWDTYGADANGDISANLLTITTTPTYTWGAQVSVAAVAVPATAERYPRAAYDGANAFIVYQIGLTTAADIYGRLVTPGAANLTLGTVYTVSAVAGSGQMYPDVAYTAGNCVAAAPINRYMVVWQDYRNNASNPDIYASPMSTAGTVETAVAISTNTTYIKERPVIAADSGSCSYITAWSDQRNVVANAADIYANVIGYPRIDNLGPNSGPVGTTISINGFNFGNDPGAGNRNTATNNVKLNGVPLLDSDITLWSNMTINFVIPAGTTLGTYPVAVTAGSWNTNSSNLTVTPPALQITTSILPYGYQWLSYTNTTLTASGGTSPYSNWQIVIGALPDGLTINPATGEISGTPTGIEASETVNFTVQVSDSVPNIATKALSITVYKLASIAITDVGGTPVSPNIYDLQTYQFKARGTYSDLSQSDVSNISALQWKSSNVNIATINTTGLATGVAPGMATICAVTANEACP